MHYGQISKVQYLSHRWSLVWRTVGVIFLWLERDRRAKSPLSAVQPTGFNALPLSLFSLLLFHSIQSLSKTFQNNMLETDWHQFKHCENNE